MPDRLHRFDISSAALARFFAQNNAGLYHDFACSPPAPVPVLKRDGAMFIGVTDVGAELVDIVKVSLPQAGEPVKFYTLLGIAEWLGDYHRRDAQRIEIDAKGKRVVRPLRLRRNPWGWLMSASLGDAACCWVGDAPLFTRAAWDCGLRTTPLRRDLLATQRLICDDRAHAAEIYAGLREREPEVYPAIEIKNFVPGYMGELTP